MCKHLEPEIFDGILIAWYCESLDCRGGLCPHIGDESIWCPLIAHGVTSQTVEDDTTEWEIHGSEEKAVTIRGTQIGEVVGDKLQIKIKLLWEKT